MYWGSSLGLIFLGSYISEYCTWVPSLTNIIMASKSVNLETQQVFRSYLFQNFISIFKTLEMKMEIFRGGIMKRQSMALLWLFLDLK